MDKERRGLEKLNILNWQFVKPAPTEQQDIGRLLPHFGDLETRMIMVDPFTMRESVNADAEGSCIPYLLCIKAYMELLFSKDSSVIKRAIPTLLVLTRCEDFINMLGLDWLRINFPHYKDDGDYSSVEKKSRQFLMDTLAFSRYYHPIDIYFMWRGDDQEILWLFAKYIA